MEFIMENLEKEKSEIIEQLKKGLLSVNPELKDTEKFFDKDNNLKNQKNNLFKNEDSKYVLGEDADSVYSSKAMIYNTFYNGGVQFIKGKLFMPFENFYNLPLPTIQADSSDSCIATLDVSVLSTDKLTFKLLEPKCLEWFDSPSLLNKEFLNPEKYMDKEAGDVFIPFIKSIIDYYDPEHQAYISKFNVYDAFEMVRDLIGLYNLCRTKPEEKKIVKLLNIVWDAPQYKRYQEEEAQGREFVAYAMEYFTPVFEKMGLTVSIQYIKYSDFLTQIDWSKDTERRNYLNRYVI